MAECAPHVDCNPDECFTAKLRYWRENGGLSIQYPYGGRSTFHGPTLGERAERSKAEARAKGYEAVPQGQRWV